MAKLWTCCSFNSFIFLIYRPFSWLSRRTSIHSFMNSAQHLPSLFQYFSQVRFLWSMFLSMWVSIVWSAKRVCFHLLSHNVGVVKPFKTLWLRAIQVTWTWLDLLPNSPLSGKLLNCLPLWNNHTSEKSYTCIAAPIINCTHFNSGRAALSKYSNQDIIMPKESQTITTHTETRQTTESHEDIMRI